MQKTGDKKLRCINIDCVFNSSNNRNAARNTCTHPGVTVESNSADITIAICSEFRSRKDYIFKAPDDLTEIKSGEKITVSGSPGISVKSVDKISTKQLEENKDTPEKTQGENTIQTQPLIIERKKESPVSETAEIYNLTDKPGSDFLILKKLYQPHTKRGLIGSVIIHIVIIALMWQFIATKEKKQQNGNNQRIVVVEDLEMPKFEPPDIDKIKEEEKTEESEVRDNTNIVRPQIKPKRITPNIKRPVTVTQTDTAGNTSDTNIAKFDSSLIAGTGDTSRISIPDSLRMNFSENDVGLKLWFPKGWSLIDNRQVALNQENFNGVIISTDSLSEDPGAVNMFVLIDDPNHSSFNKSVYKNILIMDDTTTIAYVTDPMKSSGKKINIKYYLFTDPKGLKNIQVNVDFSSPEMMEKYRKLVDAVVRSIRIVEPQRQPPSPE